MFPLLKFPTLSKKQHYSRVNDCLQDASKHQRQCDVVKTTNLAGKIRSTADSEKICNSLQANCLEG